VFFLYFLCESSRRIQTMSGHIGDMSPEQQEALDLLKEMLNEDLEGEMKEMAKTLLLSDEPIILRFLRARKFDVDQAFEMLYNMLKFRSEFQSIGVNVLNPSMCENELKTGKSFFYSYDKEGRPVCYIRTALHDPSQTDSLENQRYCVLMMEYGKKLLTPPGETVTIVFDMTNAAIKNLDLKSVQFMVATLQSYYPESLGRILVYNATWIVNGVWKIVRPWLDPVTAAKVSFIKQEEFTNFIPAENLPTDYGGKDPFVYNYTAYRSQFVKALGPVA